MADSRSHPSAPVAKSFLAALAGGGLACALVLLVGQGRGAASEDSLHQLASDGGGSLAGSFEATAFDGRRLDAARPAWLEDSGEDDSDGPASARRLRWCISQPQQEACSNGGSPATTVTATTSTATSTAYTTPQAAATTTTPVAAATTTTPADVASNASDTTTTAGAAAPETTTTGMGPLPCYLDPGFPVGNCHTISAGSTCQASTINHACMASGTFTFSCPSTSGTPTAYSQRLSIGSTWGTGSYFEVQSGGLGYDENGFPKRSAELVSVQGSFDVKCRVCGAGLTSSTDADPRAGHVEFNATFGPNVLNGVVDETGIRGYRIYLVNECSKKLTSSLAYVTKSNNGHGGTSVSGTCGCPSSTYSVKVKAELPYGTTSGHLMIVPVTTGGYDLPVGTITGQVQDDQAAQATNTSVPGQEPADIQIAGSVEVRIDCAQAASYVSRSEVMLAWQKTITDYTGVPQQYVSVSLTNRCPARRLALGDAGPEEEEGRALSGTTGQVTVGYVITLTPAAQSDASVPQAATIQQAMSAPNAVSQLSQLSSANVDQQMASTGITFTTVVVGVSSVTVTRVDQTSSIDKGLLAAIVIGSASGVLVCVCALYCVFLRSKKPAQQPEPALTGSV